MKQIYDIRYTIYAMIILACCGLGQSALRAASVLISLQTCGIAPAANRNLVLTPLQAEGSGAVPVMDKIQTNTDQNGNARVSLMPGVYQTDVRPAWGQVGVTEFYFYVDPSNAVQSAFTNLLTATNNTYPPNQYAYSAQASDARYAPLPVTSNNVASINPAQIYPPVTGSSINAVTNGGSASLSGTIVITNTAPIMMITNPASGTAVLVYSNGNFSAPGFSLIGSGPFSRLINDGQAQIVVDPTTGERLYDVNGTLQATISPLGITGNIPAALAAGIATNTVSGQPPLTNNAPNVTLGGTFGGSFNGNGGGLTNVNAAQLKGQTSGQFAQYASSNILGIVYYKTNWSSTGLADFNPIIGSGTLAGTFWVTNNPSGALILAGNSFNGNYLEITNMIGSGWSDSENWSISVNFTVLSQSGNYLFFLGKRGANPNVNAEIKGAISYYGLFQFASINGGGNFQPTDSTFGTAIGNNVTITIQELADKYSETVLNNTSNYITSLSVSGVPTNGDVFTPPNTGYYVIYGTGSSVIQVNSIKITDYTPTNASWGIVGDSVVTGLQAEQEQYRVASILQKRLGVPIVICQGNGDGSVQVSNDVPYIEALRPQNVILRFGRNDEAFATPGVFYTNVYNYVVTSLTNAGINVWHLLPEPDGNQFSPFTNIQNYLMSQYPTSVIPVTNNWNSATMLSVDVTHPNPLGYLQLADDVAAIIPAFASRYNQDEYHPFDLYQLTNSSGAFTGWATNGQGSGFITNRTLYFGGIVITNIPHL
jgi:hypothetical protein